MEKKSKITAVQAVFLVEALLFIEPPSIVPPNENAPGIVVILDFVLLIS